MDGISDSAGRTSSATYARTSSTIALSSAGIVKSTPAGAVDSSLSMADTIIGSLAQIKCFS